MLDTLRYRLGTALTLVGVALVIWINYVARAAEPWVVDALWAGGIAVTLMMAGPVRRRREGKGSPLPMLLFMGPFGPLVILTPFFVEWYARLEARASARVAQEEAKKGSPARKGRRETR